MLTSRIIREMQLKTTMRYQNQIKPTKSGVPVAPQHLGSIGTLVGSRAQHSGLRIQCCCSGSLGHDCSSDLIPDPGTPYARGWPKKKTEKPKKLQNQIYKIYRIKTAGKYHLTPVRVAIVKKTRVQKGWARLPTVQHRELCVTGSLCCTTEIEKHCKSTLIF